MAFKAEPRRSNLTAPGGGRGGQNNQLLAFILGQRAAEDRSKRKIEDEERADERRILTEEQILIS